MSKKSWLSALLMTVLAVGSTLAGAQKNSGLQPSSPRELARATSQQPASIITTPELTKPILDEIEDIAQRTVASAEDFPDDLYNTYRPKGDPDVRTAAQILLHIAAQNYGAAKFIRTKQQEEALIAAGKQPAAKDILTFVSKEDTVTKVKGSFAAVRQAIQENPDPKNLEIWLHVIAHGNGHFGNLVTYYRNNGLVPPTSRQ